MRLIPEGIKFFDDRDKRKHELALADKELAQTRLQFDLDQARSKSQLDLVHAQGESNDNAAMLQGLLEAVKGQAQPSGIRWVDALSALVRPLTTYWILAIYSVYKASVIWGAWTSTVSFKEFGSAIWTADDAAMLSGILTFWFLSREFGKMRAGK